MQESKCNKTIDSTEPYKVWAYKDLPRHMQSIVDDTLAKYRKRPFARNTIIRFVVWIPPGKIATHTWLQDMDMELNPLLIKWGEGRLLFGLDRIGKAK